MDKVSKDLCFTQFISKNSRIGVDFFFTIWEQESSSSNDQSAQLKLIESFKLRSSKLGVEKFPLSVCASENQLIGLAFVDRALPFKSSRETGNNISMIASNSESDSIRNNLKGYSKTFISQSTGKMPVQYSFTDYIEFGNYDINMLKSENLLKLADDDSKSSSSKLLLVFNDKKTTNDLKIEDFTSLVSKECTIDFVSLQSIDFDTVKVKKIWSFSTKKVGTNIFDQIADRRIMSESLFGIHVQKNCLFFKVSTTENKVMVAETKGKLELNENYSLNKFNLEPIGGMRADY